jgi:ankyrin repeat protein
MSLTTVNNRLRASRKSLKKGILHMAKNTLHQEAPSRDNRFTAKITQMIKPNTIEEDTWAMICAALGGELKIIRKLIAKNPRLVECTYNYTQPIQFAVREGHLEVVRFLLDQGASPTYRTYELGDSLITIAKDRGHREIVDLLEKTIQQESESFSTETETLASELLSAVNEQNYEKVAMILEESPARARLSNSLGITPLHSAVSVGDFYLVRYLIDKGADINAQGGSGFDRGKKPIHDAIYAGWRERDKYDIKTLIAGYLIAKGADYNILIASALGDTRSVCEFLEEDNTLANFRDTCDRVPIGVAARRGHREIVELLLEHGADPNAPEPDAPRGKALFEAAFHNHTEMAKILLKYGADPNASVDSSGVAVKHARKNTELYELMLKHGGKETNIFEDAINTNDLEAVKKMLKQDPNLAKDPNGFHGEGIMSGVAKKGYREMIKLLMDHGATVPNVSKWGASYYFQHIDIAENFLKNGMDPNHKNWLGITVLHRFAGSGNIEKAQLVLSYGADIHARDTEYCTTPLGYAARQGQKEMVKFLLMNGSRTNLPDDEAWATPLAWAEKKGHAEIADLLRANGATA